MYKSDPETTAICRILLDAKGKAVSDTVIADSLSMPIGSVREGVQRLIAEGFNMITTSRRHLLQDPPEYDLAPTYIASLLTGEQLAGASLHVFDSLDSTQVKAKELGRSSDAPVTVVFSEEQTHGRGRRDRRWLSPRESGLFFSIFLRPLLPAHRLQLVNLAAGLAVKSAAETLHSIDLALKWPNDLLYREKKVCGILSEASFGSGGIVDCRTGIGINISPPSLVESDEEEILSNACFISEIAGRVHRGELAAAILRCFFELLRSIEADDGRELLSLYKDSCSTLGREVRVVSDDGVVTGRAIRIGENGELVVKTRDREFAFCAADVIHATPNE